MTGKRFYRYIKVQVIVFLLKESASRKTKSYEKCITMNGRISHECLNPEKLY